MVSSELRVSRLRATDVRDAKRLFALMADVFETEHHELSDAYVEALLLRSDVYVLAAFEGDDVVGGITAHTLPMTRSESSEIFIYDLAVAVAHQRRGIGRQLVGALRSEAGSAGVHDLFVAADDEDAHALDFYRAVGGAPSSVTMFTFARRG